QHALYQDFESPEAGFGAGAKRMETDVSLNKSINTGMGALGLQLDVNHQELINGASLSTINTRQSMGQGGIRLTHQTTTNLRDGEHTASSGILSATTRVRRVNLRGTVNYGIYPDVDLTSVQLDGRFTENDGLTAGAGVTHDFVNSLTGISGLVGYDFGKVLASVDVDWLQERGVQMVLRASTSLAPFAEDGGYMMSSDKLTAARPVRARLFLDNDMNNIFNDGDTPLEDARIQVGLRSSDAVTNADGIVTALQSGGMGGISSVQVDRGSLIDPYHVPGIEGYNAIPREGTIVDVDLPVVETGAIDGTVTRSDGEPVAGMKLELVDNNNAVAMTTETAYDGFYTFDYVRIGTYTVRADPSYGVNVPPISVSVASDELFAYGQDLDLLERAAEADVAEPDGVAHTPSVPNIQTSQPAPSSSSGDAFKAVVKKVRIGEHPDKLRLVLDLSATATYSVTPDGDGMGLTVNLPATAWDALRSWRSDTTPVMQSYSVEALPEGGTVWRIEGRGKIAAVLHGVLPPADGKGYRLFIDLQAAP
ncbi:MAG: carboxypeptidase regulatory-like domain-containing protein, partial [Alphaproteobacteria bacterium]|nr:carboxypeptidase regulatory-like domain-containing protein [Alphaproteobacteria bacterium]